MDQHEAAEPCPVDLGLTKGDVAELQFHMLVDVHKQYEWQLANNGRDCARDIAGQRLELVNRLRAAIGAEPITVDGIARDLAERQKMQKAYDKRMAAHAARLAKAAAKRKA